MSYANSVPTYDNTVLCKIFVHCRKLTKNKIRQTDRHPFNDFFSRTTWVTRHQKSETNLDFNEAQDDWVTVASAGPYASHLHPAPYR